MDYGVFLLLNAILFVRPGEFVADLDGLPIYNALILLNLALAALKIAAKLSWNSLREEPITCCVLGIGLAVFLSHASQFSFTLARENAAEFAKIILYYLLLVATIDTPLRLRGLLACLVAYILLVTVLALLHYHGIVDIPALSAYNEKWQDSTTGELAEIPRLRTTGIFNDPNDLSLILVVGIAASLFLWAPYRGCLPRPHWLIPGAVFLYALTLTHSRGGFLAFLASIAVLSYTKIGGKKSIVVLSLLLPAMLVLFAGRQTSISASDDGTGQDRIQLWAQGFAMFAQSPIFGVGHNTYADHAGLVAHNSYVHVLAELGLVGCCCFVGAFAYALRSFVALSRPAHASTDPSLERLGPFLAAMLVGYGFGMLTVTRSNTIPPYMILGMVAAYLRLVARDQPSLDRRGGPIAPLDLRLVGWMVLVTLGFALVANLFIKTFARWS